MQAAAETNGSREGRAPHLVLRLLVTALRHKCRHNLHTHLIVSGFIIHFTTVDHRQVERRLPALRSKGR